MKKTVSLILALVLICTTLFSLTSCGGSADTDKAVAEATAPLKAQIEALEKTISHAEARIAELEEDRATLTAEKNALTEENTTLKATVAELEAEIAKLEAEVARLKSALDGDTAVLNSEIERLEAEINTLKADKSTLTARVSELEGEIAELEATISEKDNLISALNLTILTLTSEKETLIEEKNALLEENAALRNCLKGIHCYENNKCIFCDADSIYIRDNGYIYLGEYPQTIKADGITITNTTDSRGYYLGSDGYYYAKVIATPYKTGYTFSNETSVIDGEEYYFKVEPIRWRILSEENGEALILCDSIIEKTKFQSSRYSTGGLYYTKANGAPEGTYANNYEYSEVRAWLNSTFLENTFSEAEQAKILTTLVDNSVASTGYTSNSYACNDTNDKIFLLSAAEVTSSDYGFSTDYYDTARYMVLSDYARALGLAMSTSSSTYGNGYWWLRSPGSDISDYARNVFVGGFIDYLNVDYVLGVVPAL